MSPLQQKRVCYFTHPDIGNYHYGPTHPMKPHRLALTNELVWAYGLPQHMQVVEAAPATIADLLTFHSADYVAFLKRVRPPEEPLSPPTLDIPSSTIGTLSEAELKKRLSDYYRLFNFEPDCPPFAGLYDFCSLYSGASLHAARHLIRQQADVVINWSGGLHHARKAAASGFCYVNDICLAIIELLRRFPRVLYVDIDVHHGDGVQEPFYASPRVMTVSFHQYGDGFFPGTGANQEIGVEGGTNYCVNVPLKTGIDDAGYEYVFTRVMDSVIDSFRPSAIVLQCGADSLAGDRLGGFNLSIAGHGACIAYMRRLQIPLLVLGGGGYTIRNVSRCWTHETALLAGVALDNQLPPTPYDSFFGPDRKLHPPLVNFTENANDRAFLDAHVERVREQLRSLQPVPSIACFDPVPLYDAAFDAVALKQSQILSLAEEEEQEVSLSD